MCLQCHSLKTLIAFISLWLRHFWVPIPLSLFLSGYISLICCLCLLASSPFTPCNLNYNFSFHRQAKTVVTFFFSEPFCAIWMHLLAIELLITPFLWNTLIDSEILTVVVTAFSFICCKSKFSLAFVIFSDVLNDIFFLILLKKFPLLILQVPELLDSFYSLLLSILPNVIKSTYVTYQITLHNDDDENPKLSMS